MALLRATSAVWIKTLLAAGALLAVAQLWQTILNYQFVATSLIRQEARRLSADTVRSVERAARMSRPERAEAFDAILEDIRAEASDQIASITLLRGTGQTVAAAGQTSATSSVEPARVGPERIAGLASQSRDGRDVLVGVFPCRCTLPLPATAAGPPGGNRLFLEVAVYPETLSASFARLKRNAAISAAAALALFVSVLLIAIRFGPYVRGKQLDAEMNAARQVQRDLLPAQDESPQGLDVAAHCTPAWQVGGDFYDVVTLRDGRVVFVVGDVAGHGISAALLMGLIHGAMSSPPWGESGSEPDRGAARLNQLLLTKSSGERYASLFWCAYDPGSGVLQHLNAGHPPPIWMRRGPEGSWAVERLTRGGPVLGLLNSASYDTTSIEVREGDLLVLFSDGIAEAVNRRDEPFGDDRLLAVLRQHSHDRTRAICDAVLAALKSFTDGRPALDDQTLLVVRLWRSQNASSQGSESGSVVTGTAATSGIASAAS